MIKHNNSGWRIAAVSQKAPLLPRLRRRWMGRRSALLVLFGCALLALAFVALRLGQMKIGHCKRNRE